MSAHRRVLILVACLIVLSACRVEATVTVRMRENGSGAVIVRVELDRAAVRAAEIGDGKLEDRVRLADLPAAGWTVEPWQRRRNGGAILVISKTFSRPSQVRGIVAELNGGSGPVPRNSGLPHDVDIFDPLEGARPRRSACDQHRVDPGS